MASGVSITPGVSAGINALSILAQTHTPVNYSDATATESSALFSYTIPANTLGPNSTVIARVKYSFTDPATAATKRLRGRFGGTVLWNLDITTSVALIQQFEFSNRNSLASQIASPNSTTSIGTFGSTNFQESFTVDFATDQTFTITAQWPVAGAGTAFITLESVILYHAYG